MKGFLFAAIAAIAVSSSGDLTRETKWYEVPDTTKVGTVLDLGSTAAITASMATNIAGRVTSNVVTKAYVEGLGISGGGGADTNTVNDLIRSYVTTNVVTTNLMARVGDTATNVVSEILFIYDESFTQKKRDYSDMTASTNWNFKGWNEEGFYDPLYVVATNGIYGSTKWQLWSVIDGQATKLSEVDHRDKNDLEIIFSNVGPSRLDVIARRCSYEEDDTLATVKTIIQSTITPTAATNAAQTVIDKNIASSNLCTVAAAQAMTNDETIVRTSGERYVNGWMTFNGSVDLNDIVYFDKSPTWNTGMFLILPETEIGGNLWIYGWDKLKLQEASEQTLPDFISSSSVTNGGAVAYADATFLKKAGGDVSGELSFGNVKISNSGFYLEKSDYESLVFIPKIETSTSLRYFSFRDVGYYESRLYPDDSDVLTQYKGDSRYLRSYTETDPTATAKAQAAIASTLSGRTYDFANGSNFTLRVYTALTNVIQTLGGTVANPPNFN